jgi:hypothetical protein
LREAKARAFLTVPLYKAIFKKYKRGVLPAAATLERARNGKMMVDILTLDAKL